MFTIASCLRYAVEGGGSFILPMYDSVYEKGGDGRSR